MKKRLMSLILATMMVFSLLSTSAFAMEIADASELSTNEAGLPTMDIPLSNVESTDLEYTNSDIILSNGGQTLADLTNVPSPTSAVAITQEFTGYLSSESEYQYVKFTLQSGQIVHASLTCPHNPYLDYGLYLGTVEDETITLFSQCNLGTYIDPQTNKTVDEGLSFIHNQASAQEYAVVVMSSSGSSTEDEFKLKISLDVAGSFDNNEPNDNPFTATAMNMRTGTPASGSVFGSLNAETDQDWYYVTINNDGVFNLSAGDYVAEPYYVTTGNKMVLAPKAGGNYALYAGIIYYIKVSAAVDEEFTYGSYTLSIVDQSKYSTMNTAFDFGDWDNIYKPQPEAIPIGQQEAFYKFNIDTYDKVYAYISLIGDYGEQYIEVLSPDGRSLNSAHTAVASNVITTKTGAKRLVVDIDGSYGSTIYLRVYRYDPFNYYTSMRPIILTRLQLRSGTFKFTGSASNAGHSTSSSIYCDLSNNTSVHKSAIVNRVTISGTVSPSVSGITMYVKPGVNDWLQSPELGILNTTFTLGLEYNIKARTKWEFKYAQTAYASTKMSNVSMTIDWYADIKENNYEFWS